jgi:hypothetical protein
LDVYQAPVFCKKSKESTMAVNNEKVAQAARMFEWDYQGAAAELHACIQDYGYDFVKPTLHNLEAKVVQTADRVLLTSLRRPEWQWFRAETVDGKLLENIRFFGLEINERVVIRGYYVTGRMETGCPVVLAVDDVHEGYRPVQDCEDPMPLAVPRRVKTKVYKTEGAYWLAKVGRIVDLVRSGFTMNQIKLTNGKGYLASEPAFVLAQGPFDNVETARAAKAT